MVATQKEAFRFAFINLVRPTDDSSPAPDARLDDTGDSNRQTSRLGHVHPLKGWSFRRSGSDGHSLTSLRRSLSLVIWKFVSWHGRTAQIFKMGVPTWICWEGIGCHLGGLKITKKPGISKDADTPPLFAAWTTADRRYSKESNKGCFTNEIWYPHWNMSQLWSRLKKVLPKTVVQTPLFSQRKGPSFGGKIWRMRKVPFFAVGYSRVVSRDVL